MTDIDRYSGAPIDNWSSTLQSVEIILTTRIGTRVMLREFGAGIIEMLGRKMTPNLFQAYLMLVATAIDLWEPRLVVRKITTSGSIEEIRLGTIKISLEVDYRPKAHLGDFRVERVARFSLVRSDGRLRALA